MKKDDIIHIGLGLLQVAIGVAIFICCLYSFLLVMGKVFGV